MPLGALEGDGELVLAALLALSVGLDLKLSCLFQVLPNLFFLAHLPGFQEGKRKPSFQMNIFVPDVVYRHVN